MNYRAKEKKIELAAQAVRAAAIRVGSAQAASERAEEKVYEARNEHNSALRAYRAVVAKIVQADALVEGRAQGRRALSDELKASAKAVKK